MQEAVTHGGAHRGSGDLITARALAIHGVGLKRSIHALREGRGTCHPVNLKWHMYADTDIQ